jgi:uncharacterized protein with HEPN domain
MRDDDRIRVQHMIDAAEAVERFIAGRQRNDLDTDRMLLFALVRAVEIVGEAAGKASAETRAAAADVPWNAIVSMSNRLIHRYFDIDTEIMWKTVTSELPPLLAQLRAMIRAA